MGYQFGFGQGLRNLLQLYNDTNRWLDKATKKGTWTETDQKLFDLSYGHNWMIDLYKGQYDRSQYMKRYGIDWGGVVQPWNLPGSSAYSVAGDALAGLARKGLNFVSHNYEDLYEDKPKKRPKNMSYEMAMDLYMEGYR